MIYDISRKGVFQKHRHDLNGLLILLEFSDIPTYNQITLHDDEYVKE